jgi:hypothetical protein
MKTLQTILHQANASHSGKKETLVERVLALGVDVMAYFPDKKLWICCDQLKPLITAYIEEEFQREENTISSAKKALEEGDFSSLARIAAKYQTEDLFYGFSYTLASRHIAEHHPGEIERINEKAPSIDEVEKRLLRCFEPFQALKKNRPAPFKDVPDELFERAIYSRLWPMLQINNTRFLKEDEEHIGEKLLQWLRSSGADI